MKNLILLFTLLMSYISISQEAGLFGKKNLISISAQGSFPLLQNVAIFASRDINPKVKYKNGAFEEGYYLFNGGLNLGFIHARSKVNGFGFEIEALVNTVSGPNKGYVLSNDIYKEFYIATLQHESLALGYNSPFF